MKVTRIGLDIAKQVFQVHGVDERGQCIDGEVGLLARLRARAPSRPRRRATLLDLERAHRDQSASAPASMRSGSERRRL